MGRVRYSLRVAYSASLSILVGFEFVNSLHIIFTQNRLRILTQNSLRNILIQNKLRMILTQNRTLDASKSPNKHTLRM